MNRRGFLLALAAGTAAGLTGCDVGRAPRPRTTVYVTAPPAGAAPLGHTPTSVAPPSPTPDPTATPLARVTPDSVIDRLPGQGRNLALTVDDGTSSEVVGADAKFARDSGVRLTFFLNGINRSWTDHADALRPLADSGQVQFGNHTWSHPDLRSLSDTDIATQLQRNETFVRNTYGVSTKPYVRPPYGFHNPRVDRVAANAGFSVITLWWGSLGDSSVLTPEQIMANARTWFQAQRIVIGHANHPAVTQVYGELLDLIRERNLHTVTLNDVFATGGVQPA